MAPTLRAPRVLLLVLAGCSGAGDAPLPPRSVPVAATPPAPAVREVTLAEVGLDASIMDRSVNACDDLYQLACGRWLESTPIPPGRDGWERSFSEMRVRTEGNLKAMLEAAAADPRGDPTRAMLGDFHAACMDEAAVDARGASPVEPTMRSLERAASREELVHILADLDAIGVYALVRLDVVVDELDSSRVAASLRRTGWGLDPRDYTDTDPWRAQLRTRYGDWLRASLVAAGVAPAAAPRKVRHAMAIEARLSAPSVPAPAARARPTRLTMDDLVREAPRFPWKTYLGALGQAETASFNVVDVAALRRVAEVVGGESLEALRDYAQVRALQGLTYVLGRSFTDPQRELLAFRRPGFEPRSRTEDCVRIARDTIPQAVLHSYAAHVGFDAADPHLRRMVEDVYAAWDERLEGVEWLDPPTREAALRKLRAMPYHVGFPAHAPVETLRFDRESFAGNVFQADRAARLRALATVGREPDRRDWIRNPLEVTAYHDHERNSVFIHMAMLQPPIYDRKASMAVQYGTMGMTIGHELAHGFDHHGAEFDHRGTRSEWWSERTKAEFESRKRCFEEQFSTYPIAPDLNVDGKLSVGENIADVAGLRMAYRAYRKRRASDAPEQVVAEGFTEDQQFFLARAQAWCVVMTDEAARRAAKTNPHIYPRWAVNGPVHHLPEFQQAFGCEPAEDTCSLW